MMRHSPRRRGRQLATTERRTENENTSYGEYENAQLKYEHKSSDYSLLKGVGTQAALRDKQLVQLKPSSPVLSVSTFLAEVSRPPENRSNGEGGVKRWSREGC
ncbi:hypothetical protein GWI33_022040 [Rhynchophorus ferrugineus]|uniref:Uncharacterized protein n=1 Tax=Rhynchophorus ferrugineus TaxID=354439 RepID=A0A834MJ90_RHYFE|nr:hypothetical protein GWI33_022040 [Rhynchophorus ferrugineus]